jgi:acyl-coenzyme A thioesterase PaaI-like protein
MPLVSPRTLRRFMNFWPPLLFAGIRVRRADADYRFIESELKLRFWNKNAMGSQFGGSLFAMTDPFFMLMLQYNLGETYIIWDKAASIDFISPGRGTVRAQFKLTQGMIDEIVTATAGGEKFLPAYQVEITDKAGTLIAKVSRTLYVRLKPKYRPGAA